MVQTSLSSIKSTTRRIASGAGSRLGILALTCLALIGCDAGTIGSDIPEISQPIPALPVDVMSPANTSLAQSDPFLTGLNSLPQTVTPAAGSTTIRHSASLSMSATMLLQETAARGGVRIMAAGDVVQDEGAGYLSELARLLNASECAFRMVGSQHAFEDGGTPIAHEGYRDHTAGHYLTGHESLSGNNAGIADAVSYQSPDLVILHLGATDLLLGRSVAATLADIGAVIETIFEYKPDTVVVVASVIPVSGIEHAESARLLNGQLQQAVLAHGNPLLSMVDVSSGFSPAMLHEQANVPNAAGNRYLAETLFGSLFTPSLCR